MFNFLIYFLSINYYNTISFAYEVVEHFIITLDQLRP